MEINTSSGRVFTTVSTQTHPGLLLVRVDADKTKISDDCWKPPEPERPTGSPTVAKYETIEPGESIREEYGVWGHYGNEGCIPTREYTFENHHGFRGSEKLFDWELRVDVREA